MNDISIALNPNELLLLWMCAKYLEVRLPQAQEKKAVASLLEKLKAAREGCEESGSPYDVTLHLSTDEVSETDCALHLMMADTTLAKKFGVPADAYVGKTRISELADFVPAMGSILRRLYLSERLTALESQMTDLQKRIEQLQTQAPS